MPTVICEQNNKHLNFYHNNNYQTRGIIVEKLIRESINTYSLENLNFKLVIWTGDYLGDKLNQDLDCANNDMYCFCSFSGDYSKCFPSWIYDSWIEIGVEDTTSHVSSFINSQPLINKIGWIGNIKMHENRKIFFEKFKHTSFTEAGINFWNSNTKPMSLQEQIDRWKYLIDLNANGYSGRLIFLLSSPRIVFIVDTKYKEWYWEFLEPWKHYIPIKYDFSDLKENFDKIESDKQLQEYIHYNQQQFAKKYLIKEVALKKIANILITNSTNDIFNMVFK